VGHVFTEFSLLLISSWMQFLKYINFSTLSEDLLYVFIVWLISHLQEDMTWIFIFSIFTYRPVSLVTNNAGVFFDLWYICICAINYNQHKAGACVSHSISFSPGFLDFSWWHKLKKSLKVSAINHVFVSEHSLYGNRQILPIHTTV